MNERPHAMHYEAAAHADGYELEVLADLASHQFDDLDKFSTHGHDPAPAHASPSSWRRADAHPPTPLVPSTSFLPAANYWNPVRSTSPAMTSHHHQTTHHHSSTSQSTFPSYEQPPPLTDTPRASGSSAAPRYATSVASSGSEHLTADEAELRRQRNTAASARFRAKKKRREQSLERGAREKRERVEELEGRIRELEVENGWLRDLIMETTGGKGKGKEKEGKGEREGEVPQREERKGRERKDGVGT